jgi:antirestriction protein
MAKIYVSTYAKYNQGTLSGAWLDLEEFADMDDFFSACHELHNDDNDPEFMFQDWEDIPSGMITESSLNPEIFDWLQMSDSEKEVLEVYKGYIDQTGSLADAERYFHGKTTSAGDFMAEYWEESGALKNVPPELVYHIDWDAVARDSGFTFVEVSYQNVFVFSQ